MLLKTTPSEAKENAETSSIHAIAVKLSSFCPQEATSWFRRAEIQFRLRRVTDPRTKADYVLEAIPEQLFPRVAAWLDNQDQNQDVEYENLKSYLLQEFTLSVSARAQKLLSLPHIPLGDTTAHAAWNEMQALATLPDLDPTTNKPRRVDLMRELWLQRLPPSVRSALHEADDSPINDLIKKADNLINAARASRKPDTTYSASAEDVPDINAANKRRPNSQVRHYKPGSASSQPSHGFCYYHYRFGAGAHKCLPGCQWPKKRVMGPPLPAKVATQNPRRGNVNALDNSASGFFITDSLSGRKFLVDTGAFRSLFPATAENKTRSWTRPSNANGSPIPMYGIQTIAIQAAGRSFTWDFIIADVKTPLLGADFLGHHGLLVDVANRRLLDVTTFCSTPLGSNHQYTEICTVRADTPYDSLCKEYPDVFRPELRQQPGQPAKHGIFHYIKTTGPPVHSKFRLLSPEKLQAAKQAYSEMERMGICQKASSPWASPLHLVRKPEGTWRPCGDYRRLNLITEPDHYPLPNMADLTSNLHGAKVFSKLDLLKGYFQVPVYPEDIPKTAVITPFGTYTFNFSTFGLRNSGATFQRMMDGILGDLPFCACYVDDILIFSGDPNEHLQHLRVVLKRLHNNGLVVRQDKCQFGATSVEFLGHKISPTGVSPLPSKVDAVSRFPPPTTIKGLQEFVGMVNYYHRFLSKIAHIMEPLYNSLAGKPKKLEWGPEQQKAFETTKIALASATTLTFTTPGIPLTLTTDASSIAVGAVVEQTIRGKTHPLGFFSRKLRQAEVRYSTFDRELLAVYLAVRHFKHLLEGSAFTILTDHQPLVHAFSKPGDAWSDRQQRQLSSIAEFGCSIKYTPGSMNPVADALSRVEINSINLGIDYNEVAAAQKDDPETTEYHTAITSLQWKDVHIGGEGRTILCDVSTGRPRPLIPKSFRRKIFNLIHGLSHPSGRTTARLMKDKFIWHGMNKDIKQWARCCVACQMSKVSRHTESGTGEFRQPMRRFGHLHVDVVGPLPPSDGAQYLFTATERSTRWPEAIPT